MMRIDGGALAVINELITCAGGQQQHNTTAHITQHTVRMFRTNVHQTRLQINVFGRMECSDTKCSLNVLSSL